MADPVKTILIEQTNLGDIKRKEIIDRAIDMLDKDFSYKPKVSLNKKI